MADELGRSGCGGTLLSRQAEGRRYRRMMKRLALFTLAVMMLGIVPPVVAQEAITGLRATRVETRLAVVTWDRSANPPYDVFVDGTNVGSTNDRWFTVEGLEPSTRYAIDIVDAAGARSATINPRTERAQTFRGQSSTFAGPRFVNIWASTPASLISVERDGVVLASAERADSEFQAQVSFTDTDVEPDSTYVYRFIQAAADGRTEVRELTVTTPPIPPLITNVEAVATGAFSARVTWATPQEWAERDRSKIRRYRIYRDGNLVQVVNYGQNETTINIAPGESAQIQVAAYNGGGGALSAPVTVATPTAGSNDIGLAVATEFDTAGATPGRFVRLAWQASLFDDVDDAMVFVDQVPAGSIDNGRRASVFGLEPNRTYSFTIAGTIDGQRVESEPLVHLTRISPSRPVQDLAVLAPQTSAKATLAWRTVIWDVEILRDGAVVAVAPGGTNRFTDDGLTPGTTYEYSLRVRPPNTELGLTNDITVTTGGPAPGEVPDTPDVEVTNRSRGTVVFRVRMADDQFTQLHLAVEIRRNGAIVGTATQDSDWSRFDWFTQSDTTGAEYTFTSIGADGERSDPATLTVTAFK